MNKHWIAGRAIAFVCVATAAFATASLAQEVAGLTFDVTVTTGDSAAAIVQTGRGWIAGKHSRTDLRGQGNPAQSMPGMPGENVSLLVTDSAGVPIIAMVDHDTRKVMYPSKTMEQVREMMASLPEQPRMTVKVSNVTVDSLGAGETVSGFATKRFRLKADVSMAMNMMGEEMEQTMHLELEGDYAEELAEFADQLQGSPMFNTLASGIPFTDSSATAEMRRLLEAYPRGLPLRHVARTSGITEGGEHVQARVTTLANIKRATFPPSVFSIPEGYTEMEMPMMPPTN